MMFRILCNSLRHHRHLKCNSSSTLISVRNILSPSYSCEIDWEKRLKNELLAKISPDSFFNELTQRYVRKMKVNAVDIDIFANVITREEQLEEIQNLLYKLRKTRRTKDTLESTHHAVCRLFLRHSSGDRLINILCDRIGYGLFPDKYCYNMIMDYFIEEKNFLHAAKTASLMMLQEDLGNKITKLLGLYSVHMYVRDQDRQDWFDQESKQLNIDKDKDNNHNNDDDEDEIEYVRVPFVRNEYFDDHFDLRDPIHICGKTLYYFGKEFNDIVGRSYQIFGLVLYEKWEKAINLLKEFSQSHSEEKLILDQVFTKIIDIGTNLDEQHKNKSISTDLINFLNKLKEQGRIDDSQDLHQLVCSKLEEIKDLEQNDISEMPKLFEEWNQIREKELTAQMEQLMKEERKKEIEEKKKTLAEKERLLFFFENFSKHEMDFAEAEKLIRQFKSKTQVEEEYIPPEI